MFSIYSILRFFILILIIVITYFCIQHSKRIKNKRRSIVISLILICICVPLILYTIPFEDAFLSFSSPVVAYGYCNTGSAMIVVDGEQSSMVVSVEGNNSTSNRIFPKEGNEWKLGSLLAQGRIYNKNFGEYSLSVYQYRETNDYYIFVEDYTGTTTEISDSENSSFQTLPIIFAGCCYSYTCIQNFNENYALSINGEQFLMDTE